MKEKERARADIVEDCMIRGEKERRRRNASHLSNGKRQNDRRGQRDGERAGGDSGGWLEMNRFTLTENERERGERSLCSLRDKTSRARTAIYLTPRGRESSGKGDRTRGRTNP